MYVAPSLESLDERGVAGEMGEDAQLDLGVVSTQEHHIPRWHEALADLGTERCADRDVLEVGVGAG